MPLADAWNWRSGVTRIWGKVYICQRLDRLLNKLLATFDFAARHGRKSSRASRYLVKPEAPRRFLQYSVLQKNATPRSDSAGHRLLPNSSTHHQEQRRW